MSARAAALGALAALAGGAPAQVAATAPRVLDAAMHHLGDSVVERWADAGAVPEATWLELRFEARANAAEVVLGVTHEDLHHPWELIVNGTVRARLPARTARAAELYPLPPASLVDGANTLVLRPTDPSDDVLVGAIVLHERPLRELLQLVPVTVRVEDREGGTPLPARLTVLDATGARARVHRPHDARLAIRDGIVYAGDGSARFELPAGDYVVHATRGMEWGHDAVALVLARGIPAEARLVLAREVDTTGWIAADTHLHTVPGSDHGDATVEERVLSLLGEGVELAVATDHNHHTDYRPAQRALDAGGRFLALTGNEVNVDNRHFNAFPLDPAGPLPDRSVTTWDGLVAGMRAAGARFVQLNHPRWPYDGDAPFDDLLFDPRTGGRRGDAPFTFDGIELVNATDRQADPYGYVRDWFALLNRGERLVAVGTSDTHTVDVPPGQGRSYVASATDDPSALDAEALVDALLAGRVSVSMGIFADLRARRPDGSWAGIGDVVALGPDGGAREPEGVEVEPAAAPGAGEGGGGGATLEVEVDVRAPAWVRPREARLFMNGVEIARTAIATAGDAPTDTTLAFTTPPLRADAWLVAVVTGDALEGDFWPLVNAYTLAATNPIRIAHGAVWLSPRAQARALLASPGGDPAGLAVPGASALPDDAAVAAFAAALARGGPAVAAHLCDLLDAGEAAEAARRAVAEAALARWAAQADPDTLFDEARLAALRAR